MASHDVTESTPDAAALARDVKRWGVELGFARVGIAAIDLTADEAHFRDWLASGFDGEMHYMSRHGSKRSRPANSSAIR